MNVMLPPGTALQQGNYLIDALIEAAPNGHLYWGTHATTGLQVYLQVTPLNAAPELPDGQTLADHLRGLAFSPQSPLPSPFQVFSGEHNTLCLAVGTTAGLPWPHARQSRFPMSPRQALRTVRSIAHGAIWLEEQGLPAVDLSLNRIWISPDGDRTILTGIPLAHINSSQQASPPADPLQSLAALLYSCLSGQLPTVPDTESLALLLHNQRPEISPLVIKAIHKGTQGISAFPAASTTDALQQWLALLPDAQTFSGGESSLFPAAALPPNAPPRQQTGRVYSALTVTALIAAFSGITFGTLWRLNVATLPGAIQFDPEQSFPPQAEWPAEAPEALFEVPYVSEQDSPERLEDWGDPGQAAEPTPWDPVSAPSDWAEPLEEPIPETPLPGDDADADAPQATEEAEADLEDVDLEAAPASEAEIIEAPRPIGESLQLLSPDSPDEDVFSNAPPTFESPDPLKPESEAESIKLDDPLPESTSEG